MTGGIGVVLSCRGVWLTVERRVVSISEYREVVVVVGGEDCSENGCKFRGIEWFVPGY